MTKPIPKTVLVKVIALTTLFASRLIVSTLEVFGLPRTFFGKFSAGFVAEVVCLRTKLVFIVIELFDEYKLTVQKLAKRKGGIIFIKEYRFIVDRLG